MDTVHLPDYLPSRFRNWLHFYTETLSLFKQHNWSLNDDTTIKYYEYGVYDTDHELVEQLRDTAFVQEIKFLDVKLRAFDYLVSQLPAFEDVRELIYSSMRGIQGRDMDDTRKQLFETLLDLKEIR